MSYYGNTDYNRPQQMGYGWAGSHIAGQDPLSSRSGITGYDRPYG